MTKVFLITKLKTTNIGNQALSHEIINIFKEKVGAENLIVGGRPLNLFNFSMDEIMSSKNPEALLDNWADQVIKKYKSEKHSYQYKAEINWVSLDTLDSAAMRFEPLKKLLRPLKAKLKKYSLYNKDYEHRLNQINSSDILVYSGAGEVGVYNVFLRQMLEIRIAQKLGKKTAAVNQSVVIEDDIFKKLLLHVYGKMDKIVVRGESSKAALIKTGIKPDIFEIAPDTAIMTSSPNIRKQNKNLVGINFTPHINFDINRIKIVIDHFKKLGKEIIFITNEPAGDKEIAKKMFDTYAIKSFPIIRDYLEYAERLTEFDYIVSTRLHSNIMALSSGIPIIAIEGHSFKTTELLKELKYPVPVLSAYTDNWEQTLIKMIDDVENGVYDFDYYFKNILPTLKQEVKKNSSWI